MLCPNKCGQSFSLREKETAIFAGIHQVAVSRVASANTDSTFLDSCVILAAMMPQRLLYGQMVRLCLGLASGRLHAFASGLNRTIAAAEPFLWPARRHMNKDVFGNTSRELKTQATEPILMMGLPQSPRSVEDSHLSECAPRTAQQHAPVICECPGCSTHGFPGSWHWRQSKGPKLLRRPPTT